METSEHRTPNRVRHVAAAIACALALQLGWPAVAGAKPCAGAGSTTKCTVDSECCAGLVCDRRCQRGCKIGGVFYENGARNPLNDCQSCQSVVNRFAWTSLASGVTCGGAPSGQCDAQNTCNGAGACIDNVRPATTACTGASQGGACDDDAADRCSGTSKACVDAFDGASVVCRSSAGQCDVAETCTGTSAACPVDGFAAATASCTGASQAGACDDDASDHCSGGANTCVDAYESSTTVCRSSTGQCDVLETCTGTSGACRADAFAPATQRCIGPSGGRPCDDDAADHCSVSKIA